MERQKFEDQLTVVQESNASIQESLCKEANEKKAFRDELGAANKKLQEERLGNKRSFEEVQALAAQFRAGIDSVQQGVIKRCRLTDDVAEPGPQHDDQ